MKQIRFKHLATLGVCCSLFSNSLAGVTAVAETMTIESRPTAESTQVEEEEKTEETETQESLLKTAEQKEMSNSLIGSSRAIANFAFPERVAKFQFVDENGNLLNPSLFELTSDFALRTNGSLYNPVHYAGTDVGTTKQIIFPQTSIVTENSPSNPVFVGATDSQVVIPRFAESISVVPPTNYTGNTYVQPNVEQYNRSGSNWVLNATYTTEKLNVHKKDASTYGIGAAPPFLGLLPIESNASRLYYVAATSTTSYLNRLFSVSGVTTLYVTNRKVTEFFKNQAGATIPTPPNFEEGRKTSITNNNYTFKQSGTLPDTYTSGGKTYKFKGWYKGKTKPATLETSKTPSYAVTYDDNDDLNVVYEEIEAFDFPAITYQFGFVDESGKQVDASKVGLTYDDWYGEVLGTNVADWKTVTLEKGQVAPTKNNLKEIVYPAQSLEIMSGRSSQYSAANLTFALPKYYEKMSVYNKNGTFDAAYPIPSVQNNNSANPIVEGTDKTVSKWFELKKSGSQSFILNITVASTDVQVPGYLREVVHNPTTTTATKGTYYTLDKPVYYYLTNRRVTENFVDASGAKITPPTGFTQGKQTVIDSDPYTFKQSGTLPDTYTSGGKTYKFKGWYKGKTKPATLETSKTPSYAVTYDDNDDLNVVYEEIEAFDFPAITYQFGFLDESGKRVDASTIGMTYDNWYGEVLGTNVADWKTINIEKGQVAPTKNNLKEIVYPAQSLEIMSGRSSQYSAANLTFALPKYYEKMSVYNKNGTFDAAYPIPSVQNNNSTNPIVEGTDKTVSKWFELKKSGSQSFILNQTITAASTDVQVPGYLREVVHNPTTTTATKGTYYTLDKPVYYYLTNRKVTENFVDASGAKITPPTGFTQGKQTVIDSDPYTFKQSGTLPDTYKAGGKTYKFKGWYKGKTKPATLETTKTPSYAVTYDDKDDMTAVYEEVQPTAEMTVSRLLEVIPNEASMVWTVRLKNTSEVPLTNVKLAPTAKWAAGISAPTQLAVRISNTPNKIIPVTAEQWRTGVNLGVEIPVNGEALVTVNTAKITGEPRQLLTAEMTASGNFSAVTASNFVRIQGEDQTITPTPTEEGFISTPTFDFGKITISSSVKQYGLKKAADYYGNGTRNPYLRIKKSQPNWQLTAQLSQLKASTDSLPTSTRLLLGNANVAAIENYNQVTELTNKVGVTKALTLTSDGTSTPVILNNQFTGNDVYQLDFDFASVKLEVPANQGKINEKYQGTVTWNLVTGP